MACFWTKCVNNKNDEGNIDPIYDWCLAMTLYGMCMPTQHTVPIHSSQKQIIFRSGSYVSSKNYYLIQVATFGNAWAGMARAGAAAAAAAPAPCMGDTAPSATGLGPSPKNSKLVVLAHPEIEASFETCTLVCEPSSCKIQWRKYEKVSGAPLKISFKTPDSTHVQSHVEVKVERMMHRNRSANSNGACCWLIGCSSCFPHSGSKHVSLWPLLAMGARARNLDTISFSADMYPSRPLFSNDWSGSWCSAIILCQRNSNFNWFTHIT